MKNAEIIVPEVVVALSGFSHAARLSELCTLPQQSSTLPTRIGHNNPARDLFSELSSSQNAVHSLVTLMGHKLIFSGSML